MRRAVVALALVLAVAGATGGNPAPAQVPDELVIGLNLPSDGFQVGAVQGTRVVMARGLEIDLARALARELGVRRVTFYQESRFTRLIAAGAKPWDLALAQVTIAPERRENVDFSTAYLRADQGVLTRRGLTPVPRSIAELRRLRLCAQRGTTSASTIATTIRPRRKPLLVGNQILLAQNVQTGRCDAAVDDAPLLGVLRDETPTRYGPIAGVIRTGERYGVVLPKGSVLTAETNQALRALAADGSLRRFSRRWLTVDLSRLRVLR